jgi:hypothetical protein
MKSVYELMIKHAFRLLEIHARNCTEGWLETWFTVMQQNITLAPDGLHDAIFIVMNSVACNADNLAKWIEEEDGTYDHLPLFILWDDARLPLGPRVHAYAPFKDGVRQLMMEYKQNRVN